uniref:Uncharacterized protein n=1 Tax=Rhizophora mucronata TaxID=61149 RepID=A0A2P2P5U2_RHIMU
MYFSLFGCASSCQFNNSSFMEVFVYSLVE